jgi:hypothetical protein
MAILGGRWDIDYVNKRIFRLTAVQPSVVDTAVSLYSAIQDEFDEPGQMDDQVPMSAQTPTEFSIINQWFIDDTSIQFLNGGALQTVGWLVSTTRNIIQIEYDASSPGSVFTSADIGKVITGGTTGDTGTILAYDERVTSGDAGVVWIRPTDPSATGDLFDNGTETYTVASSSAAGSFVTVSRDGESVWGNIFTLGTLESNTDIYVAQEDDFQGGAATPVLTKISAWWTTGQIDVLIKVQEAGSLIDSGDLIVYARQYSKLYDHFNITVTGGRNAVPLATGDDLNNTAGYRRLTGNSGSGTFVVDELITALSPDFDTGKGGIVLGVSGTEADPIIDYYLIGNPLTDFVTSDTISGITSGATAIVLSPGPTFTPTSANGPDPAAGHSMTTTFGNTQQDLNNGAGSREYSVILNVNQAGGNTLQDAYQFSKYLTRRGSATTVNGQDGEFYLGVGALSITYDLADTDPPFNEAELITTSGGASAVITSRHDTGVNIGFLIVRTVKGTFANNDTIVGQTTGDTARVNGTPSTITPVKAAPFGSFAGGTFFGAHGVFLQNVPSDEANNYQLVDSTGTVQIPPNVISVAVSGLSLGDRATIFRLDAPLGSGGLIVKTEHTNAVETANSTTLQMGADIKTTAVDTPSAGVVRVVDDTIADSRSDKEQRYRYDSITTDTFNLATDAGSGTITSEDATIPSTTLIDSAADFTFDDSSGTDVVEVGDIVYNTTTTDSAVVVSVDSQIQLTTTPLSGPGDTQWGSGDGYSINVTDRAYTTSDTSYVPLVDAVQLTAGSATNTLTFDANIDVVVRVRNSSGASKILPFETAGTVTSGGLSVAAIRTDDTIAT